MDVAETVNFEGHIPRECGEHRTVGPHRAWCYDCGQWCYPDPERACSRCELAMLRARVARTQQLLEEYAERGVFKHGIMHLRHALLDPPR